MTDTDPLLDEDGNLLGTWSCPDCRTNIHLHSDPDHLSHDWTRGAIREHEGLHAMHLEHHGGDRPMMRLALRYPHVHAAIIQIHGPATELEPEHRTQILRAAGIEEVG